MSIRNSLTKTSYLLLQLILLIVVGCATSRQGIQSEQAKTPTVNETSVAPTSTPGVVVTLQPSPTTVLSTFTPTPTIISPTPLPTTTLTPEEKADLLAELMRTNGGCELPCWWGIVPGESSLETTRKVLAEKGLRVGSNSAGINGGYVVSVEFEVENSIIKTIQVSSSYVSDVHDRGAYTQGWQHYSLAEVVNRYGPPSQVLVYHPFQFDPGGGPAYHLLIFYEEVGIVVEYRGSVEQLNGDHFRACPDLTNVGSIELLLYPPGQVENVVERVLPPDNIDYIAGPETVYDLISWQEATGTSLESFYETYSTPEEGACFEFSTQRA